MRLLIHETSYRRLEAGIAAIPGVEPLRMRDDGTILLDGQTVAADDAHADAAWANADVFFGAASRAFMVALLKSPRLAWVQSGAAGFDHLIFGQIVDKGARLTTSHGQAVGIAEYVLATVLDVFQQAPERRAAQQARDWKRIAFREVMGSHWLIIGFGAIGQGVAARARAFGATVTGVRRDQAPHPAADRIAALADLPELLPQADVVVLCAPLTAETRHVADAGFFAAMKDDAVLVNVGRGPLVDGDALLSALDAGRPSHAILDVFETEPLPTVSGFWNHPRVTLTAHTSGVTSGQHVRNDQLFLENLRRYVAGEALLHEAKPGDVRA
jgi:phosphoglycerate dehydrogenase-like enzyme